MHSLDMEEEGSPLLPGTAPSEPDVIARNPKIIKFGFWGLLVMTTGLLFGALYSDQYFSIKVSALKLPKPNSNDPYPHGDETATLHTYGLLVNVGGISEPVKFLFDEHEARLNDSFFKRFEEYIVSMKYTAMAWGAVKVLLYVALSFQLLAVAFAVLFGDLPTTLSFKSGATLSGSWKNALPVWLALGSAALSVVALLLANSSVQSTASRFAFYAIRSQMDSNSFREFEAALDSHQPRTYLLDTLYIMGNWFLKKGGASWSVSLYLLLCAIFTNLSTYFAVFFLDARVVKSELKTDGYSVETDLKRLPRHCRVLPLWVSIILFVIANILTKFAGRSANNTGRALNRMPWTARIAPANDLLVRDVFSDFTRFFWIQPSALVDASFLVWIPLVVGLFIGSLNKTGLFSKFLEVLSYAYLFRTFSIVATTLPTTMTIVQLPICYEDAKMSLSDMLTTTDFCNDMLYSGHSAGAVVCVCALLFMLVYGPYRKKTVSVIVICFLALTSLLVILVGRYHFTADILVAVVVCVLISLIHAPAFKIFFHHKRLEMSSGSYKGIGRITGELERVATEVEALVKSHKIDLDRSNWTRLEQGLEVVRQRLQTLNERGS